MRLSAVVIAVALLLTDTANAVEHIIKVGANNTLVFDPTDIIADIGDTVTFRFEGKNHSVTQSTFANPCTLQTEPTVGIDSGFMPVTAGASLLPQASITIANATDPIWFFCAQTDPLNHCSQGMVFSVNAPADQTFAQFQAAAKAGGGQADPVTPTLVPSLAPGPVIPTGHPNDSTGSTSPTTTASLPTPVKSSPALSPITLDPTPTSAPSGDLNGPSTNKSKSIGPIVGGIVGGLMLVAIAIAACLYQQRRKRPRKWVDLDLAAESDSPLVVPFRSMPFRTAKRFPPSNTDISPRMVMHEDSGVRLPPIGERIFVPVVDVPPRYTSG